MNIGMILTRWAVDHGYITDEQYKDYLLQDTEFPLPKLNTNI